MFSVCGPISRVAITKAEKFGNLKMSRYTYGYVMCD